jgi:hypothetical protein
MRSARSTVIGSCFASCLISATFLSGCYRPTEKAENRFATGGTSKPTDPNRPIVHGTDIADSSNSPNLRTIGTAELVEQAKKRAEEAAAKAPKATEAASVAAAPQASGSPSATAAPVKDPYVRPAIRPLALASATAEVRESRSPVRKKPGIPPPRSRVLAAPEVGGDVIGITFDNLMFEMKATDYFSPTMLSDSVRALFDKKVKIRGYIWPDVPYQKGNTQFILVRDDIGCCFGPGALIYDNVVVKMAPGKSVDFTVRPIAVQGILRFHEEKFLDQPPTSIYRLEADSVE